MIESNILERVVVNLFFLIFFHSGGRGGMRGGFKVAIEPHRLEGMRSRYFMVKYWMFLRSAQGASV